MSSSSPQTVAGPALLSKQTLTPEQCAVCQPIEQCFLGHARDEASHMR